MSDDDKDLEELQLRDTVPDSLKENVIEDITRKDIIDTGIHGKVMVQLVDRGRKRAIFTYHDIGLNGLSNLFQILIELHLLSGMSSFGGFFKNTRMLPILRNFNVYHINAPGQESCAVNLPQTYFF